MKKLSVEQELIKIKYPYPCTVKTFNKSGEVTATRIITHNVAATDELIKLQPALAQVINTYDDDDIVKAPATVKQLLNGLGN